MVAGNRSSLGGRKRAVWAGVETKKGLRMREKGKKMGGGLGRVKGPVFIIRVILEITSPHWKIDKKRDRGGSDDRGPGSIIRLLQKGVRTSRRERNESDQKKIFY